MQIRSTQIACDASEAIQAPGILLLEEDAAVRDAVRLLLKTDGYRVSAAASLAEALEHVTDDPDIDLLGVGHHSCRAGIQLAVIIRNRLDQLIRAVAMTDNASPETRKAAPDPLTHVVSKPANELLTLLSTLLSAA